MLINHPAPPLYPHPYSTELDDQPWYGQQADIVKDCGEFCLIRTSYGYQSWIQRKYLSDWQYTSAPMAVTLPFGDIHSEKSIKSHVLLTVPRGALLQPVEGSNGWLQVRLIGGECGFIHTSAVSCPPDGNLSEQQLRENIKNTALEYLGVQYRWGGRTPLGVDCSGLCHSAYLLNGIAIYRNASLHPDHPVRSIPTEQAKNGDLLYFPGHIALYLGSGSFIHASASAGRVCINSLDPSCPLYRADLACSILCAGSVFPRS